MKSRSLLTAALLGGSVLSLAALAAGPQVPPWGVELKYIDTSVKPGNDFFAYANNGWLKTAQIPADRTYAGVNLELDLQNEAHLKAIVADLATRKDLSPEEQKLSDLYNAYMDQKTIEADGLKPAQADLNEIASLKTLTDVAREMGKQSIPTDGPFGLYIGVDDKHPTQYSVNLTQSGLGLPDRDY